MRHKYRTQDYYRIKTDRDALYYSAGIPSSSWGAPSSKPPRFKTVQVKEDGTPVTVKVQQEWFSRMMEGEFFSKPWLFLISSPEDDDASLSMGFDLLKVALGKEPRLRVHVTESSRAQWDKWREETVFLLTNVWDDAPRERLQLVRDWSFRHEDNFRVICAAGDPATLIRKTRLKFNAVFYVDAKRVIEQSFA
ncbi:MAG: hypothetical protein DRI24_21875 [Deltaproteobacteria bacterium]|nr:MAG: hypothetical protein DRI24_21875 [Deltaproteobacteria bacterium]